MDIRARGQAARLVFESVALFSACYILFLLSFSGDLEAVDELAIYARAESLVRTGSLEAPLLHFAEYHNPVGTVEPGFVFAVAPLYWLSQQLPFGNSLHAVLLLNPLLTALTAALIYAICRWLGYTTLPSLVAALAYAFGSLAWPYSQTLYREPLVAFGWTLTVLALVIWMEEKRRGALVLAILLLLALITVKATAFVGLPLVLGSIVLYRYGWKRFLVVTVGLTILALLLFQLINLLRFGASVPGASLLLQVFTADFYVRLYGLWLSPGKGLVFYMPAVLLGLAGLVRLRRTEPFLATLIALLALGVTALYATYAAWYGGLSWGPRFLIPVVPLLMIPVAELWRQARRPVSRGLIVAVLLASVAVQLGAVSAHWWPGFEPLYNTGPEPENNAGLNPANLHLSPPLQQLRRWQPEAVSLAWLRGNPDGGFSFWPGLAAGLVLSLAAAVLLGWWGSRRRVHWGWLLLPPLLATAVLLGADWDTAAYREAQTEVEGRQIASWVNEVRPAPSTVVTVSNYFGNYWYYGFFRGDYRHYWYSPAQTEAFAINTPADRLSYVSLVVDRLHMSPEHSGKELEWWLNDRYWRGGSEWADRYELIRYAAFPEGERAWQASGVSFGESFAIPRYALTASRLEPGQLLGIELEIVRMGEQPDYHQLFVHLRHVDGSFQANGHDGPIRYGQLVDINWEVGEALHERRVIEVPADAAPGVYEIVAGFETPDGPLAPSQPTHKEAAYAVLGTVEIGDGEGSR